MSLQQGIDAITKFPTYLKNLFKGGNHDHVKQIHSKHRLILTPEKQEKLELLCNQLFKQKEMITTGKFQFIGLEKIKKRMGKRWEGLSKVVYEIAEDVINDNMGRGDIFIRYNDNTYIIIFAYSSPEESQTKATKIAEEIRQRLFALDEEDLRDLEVRQAVSEIKTAMLMQEDFLDGMFEVMNNSFGDLNFDNNYEDDEAERKWSLDDVEGTEVEASGRNIPNIKPSEMIVHLPDLKHHYIPLWDTKRGALTTYLCLGYVKGLVQHKPKKKGQDNDHPFVMYNALYENRTVEQKLAIDLLMLDAVAQEFVKMEQEGRKFYIACPIQHESAYHMKTYDVLKRKLSELPEEHRRLLLIYVTNMDENKRYKNPYWFAKPLRVFVPNVFVEIPLRRDINFRYLMESGVNVVGVRLDNFKMNEQEMFNILNSFSAKAKSLKISQTFVMDVSSLSLTTSAVCAGFDFIGGRAIHKPVVQPDTVHRYQQADLIKVLSAQN